MADYEIPPGANVIPNPVLGAQGFWRLINQFRRDAGLVDGPYLKDDGWYVWTGTEEKRMEGSETQVPTLKSEWPPVQAADLIVGDWFLGPVGNQTYGQMAIYTGRPDEPFYYFRLITPTAPGIQAPIVLTITVTVDKHIALTFHSGNDPVNLSELWLIREDGTNTLTRSLPATATSFLDTDVEVGKGYAYYMKAVMGYPPTQIVSERSNTLSARIQGDYPLLEFTITDIPGEPSTTKLVTILNPTYVPPTPINYDWAVYTGDWQTGGQYKGNLRNVSGAPSFRIDVKDFGLTVDTEYWLYVAQSDGQEGGPRQNHNTFSVDQVFVYLDAPTEAVACILGEDTAAPYAEVRWRDNSLYETGYSIYRNFNDTGWLKIGTAAANATSFQDHNVDVRFGGVKIEYRVTATLDQYESEVSNTAEVVTWEGLIKLAPSPLVSGRSPVDPTRIQVSYTPAGLHFTGILDLDWKIVDPVGSVMWVSERGLDYGTTIPVKITFPFWGPGSKISLRVRERGLNGSVAKWGPAITIEYTQDFTATSPKSTWKDTYDWLRDIAPAVKLPDLPKAEFFTRDFNPHELLGRFQRPIRNNGQLFDTVGSWANVPYPFAATGQGFTKLGIVATGDYRQPGESSDAFFAREQPGRLFVTLHQNVIEATDPDNNDGFQDHNPAPIGRTFTLDNGTSFTVDVALQTARTWNIAYWYDKRSDANINPDSRYTFIRGNMENHQLIYGSNGYYEVARNIWQGGYKYASAANGGTDPVLKLMDDITFVSGFLAGKQAAYNSWLSSVFRQHIPNVRFFLYGDGQSGFMQNGGWRRDKTFYYDTPHGRCYDTFAAGSYGWMDTQFRAVPFFLARKDKTGGDGQFVFADLSLAETTTPKNFTSPGEPDFFRYTVTRDHPNGRVTIRFEDSLGNLCKTTRVLRVENDYGNAGQRLDIPVGTTVFTYDNLSKLPEEFFTKTLDDFIDDALVGYWWNAVLSWAATQKPLVHQIYPWMTALRHIEANNETVFAAQLPRRFVHGLTYLGQYYNVMQIWYQLQMYPDQNGGQNSSQVLRALNYLWEANWSLADFGFHFNRGEVTKEVEVSLDGGASWTAAGQTFRNTAYAEDHYKFSPGAYGPEWVSARKNSGQPSPLILASYNSFTDSWAIFEKCLYGNSVNYSFRARDKTGNYVYFRDRTATRDWKRDITNY